MNPCTAVAATATATATVTAIATATATATAPCLSCAPTAPTAQNSHAVHRAAVSYPHSLPLRLPSFLPYKSENRHKIGATQLFKGAILLLNGKTCIPNHQFLDV